MKKYITSNLWDAYRVECPVISRIPVFGMWGFGHFVKGYFAVKWPAEPGARV